MKKNLILASLFVLALAFWLISGCFSGDGSRAAELKKAPKPVLNVKVEKLQAEEIQQEIVITGKTIPARSVTLRAELDARVEALGAERGAKVKKGEIIAVLDERNLSERLEEAKALVEQRELEYNASKELFAKKFQSETKVAEARTALDAAKSNLRRVKIDLENTRIKAPFSGVLELREVEVGDYLANGDVVARVIEIDPIVFNGTLNENQVRQVRSGMPAFAKTLNDVKYDGHIRYVSREGNERSRTFEVELEVPNPDMSIPAGISVDIIIPTSVVKAHKVSAAMLSLDAEGALGVKVVDDEGTVEFVRANIAKSNAKDLWLTDLPEEIQLITAGQGFAQVGERVNVIQSEEPDSFSDSEE